MNNKNRDAIYARYSSHAQDDGTSIEVQLDSCRNVAGEDPLEFVDRAVTGRTMQRPEFNRMLEAAERGEFNRLLLYRYDRIGRSAHTHAVISDLEESGVEVISISEGKDQLARGIHLVVGEDFSRKLSQRVRDSLQKRFEQRSWTGGPPPYGYKIEHRSNRQYLAVNPPEADIVRYIFRTYLEGTVGFKDIARQLHDRGICTRHGKIWAFSTIRLILTNTCLVGEVRFGKRKMKLNHSTGRRVPVYLDPSTHKRYMDESLRIVSDDDFRQAQGKLASRRRQKGAVKARRCVRPFTGLIYCSECNSVYYAQKSTNGGKHFYVCACRSRSGRRACPKSVTHREDHLLDQVLEVYGDLLQDTESLVNELTVEVERELGQSRSDADRVKSEIADLDRKSAVLTAYLLDPDFSKGAKSEISLQLDQLATKRAELRRTSDILADRANRTGIRLSEEVRKVLSEAREAFSAVGSPDRLHAFIERFVGPSVSLPDGRLIAKPVYEAGTGGTGASVNSIIAATGLEQPTKTPEKSRFPKSGGAKSDALCAARAKESITALLARRQHTLARAYSRTLDRIRTTPTQTHVSPLIPANTPATPKTRQTRAHRNGGDMEKSR